MVFLEDETVRRTAVCTWLEIAGRTEIPVDDYVRLCSLDIFV
jgi:hypothetical protein